MRNRIQFYFIDWVAIILFFAAALNWFAAINPAAVLDEKDTIFSMPHRWILFLEGGIELFASAFLLLNKKPWTRLALVIWLTTNLLVYRTGLWWYGESDFGDCLGNLYHWFNLSPRFLGATTQTVLGIILGISILFLMQNWLVMRNYNKKLAAYAAQK